MFAYRLKREKSIKRRILLGDKKLCIVINLERCALEFSRREAEWNACMRAAKNNPNSQEAYQKLGEAIINMLSFLFGEENASSILEFYEGNYGELVKQISPFIVKKIAPPMRRAISKMRKSRINGYTQA
ncbi:hypothetical protein LJC42_00315 [Eubacteriales bacterium OttesenSCG-928-K08]|nr:hypothetical protein [Eubacteriales bacterium OttesenSCG-928-K08]